MRKACLCAACIHRTESARHTPRRSHAITYFSTMFAHTLCLSSDFKALDCHSALCQDTLCCFSCISTDDASFAPFPSPIFCMRVALNSFQISPWHHFSTAFIWAKPILSTAREGWSQLLSAPRPLGSSHSQQPQFDTLVFLPSAGFFIVTGFHNFT